MMNQKLSYLMIDQSYLMNTINDSVRTDDIKELTKALNKKMIGNGDIYQAYSPFYYEVTGVSIINIDGVIGKKLSNQDKEDGKVDVDDIAKQLKTALKANTHCILLHINSVGGSSTGIEELGNIIWSYADKKPIFTFCDTVCASAAYWLACCTNGIYVTPSSAIGSIGVFVKILDVTDNLKMQGIQVKFFQGGELKTMGHSEKPMTKEEEEFITNDVNAQTIKFRTFVNAMRNGVSEDVMQGQLFNGEEAIENNLADEVVNDLDTLLEQIGTTQNNSI